MCRAATAVRGACLRKRMSVTQNAYMLSRRPTLTKTKEVEANNEWDYTCSRYEHNHTVAKQKKIPLPSAKQAATVFGKSDTRSRDVGVFLLV